MRTKEDFVTNVTTIVKEMLGSGYQVDTQSIRKNNDTEHLALQIRKVNACAAPLIYIDQYYEAYRLNEADLYTIVQRIVDTYEHCMMSPTALSLEDWKGNLSKEFILEHVFFKVVNGEMNEASFSSVPHRNVVGDLAMVFCVMFDSSEDGVASVTLTNLLCELKGITEQELFDNAMQNTPLLFPMETVSFASFNTSMMNGTDESEADNLGIPALDKDFFILTNSRKVNGASTLLYPGVLKDIANHLGTDFYIIPSSIHELLILKDSNNLEDAESLTGVIKEVNDTQLSNEEILSYKLYHYNRQLDTISVA